MKVTKQIAETVATKLLAKRLEKLNQKKATLEEKATQFYKEVLPKEVLECFNKHSSFFRTSMSFSLNGEGFHYENFYMTESLPQSNVFIDCFGKEKLKNLYELKEFYKTEKMRIEEAHYKLTATLLSLKTYKNVYDAFPEAAEHLPEKSATSMLPANIEEMRKLIEA